MQKKLIVIGIVVAVVVVVGITGVVLATTGSSKKTASASSPQTAFADYRSCLSDHGVKLPTRPNGGRGGNGSGTRPNFNGNGTPPGAGNGGGFRGGPGGGGFGNTPPPGISKSTWTKAMKACQSKRPKGGFGAGGARRNPAQFQAYLSCLKDHGVNVDPNGGAKALQGIDRTSSAFQTANQTCGALLRPNGGQGSTSTTTTAPTS